MESLLQHVRENLNKLLNSKIFLIILGLILYLKTILFYKDTVYMNESLTLEVQILTFIYIASMMLICLALPKRGRIITALILNLLISVILFADDLYYSYSSNALSVAQITNIQYGEEIMSTLPMLIKFKHILYFIDLIIIVLALLFKFLKIEKGEKSSEKQIVIRIVSAITGIAIFAILSVVANERVVLAPYNKSLQIRKGTIVGYHVSDIFNCFQETSQAVYKNKEDMVSDYESLKQEYNEKYSTSNYDLQGAMQGKNVIILQLESIQEFVLHKTINGKEITPNLNRFLDENIEFSNMFMQSYSSTADSEFSTISSLYPMENGMSFSKYYQVSIEDIFSMFHQKDYTTSYMHGNDGNFWNRKNVYERLPVDNIEFKDNFSDISEHIMGYLSDELLYKQAVEKLEGYNEPFFTYIVSASSHTGFTLEGLQDMSKVQIDVGKYKGTFFGNYLESVNYADYAFGIFIDELKKAGLYDDTIILLYGDHNGLEMYNEEMIDFLKQTNPDLNDTDIKLNYIRVACGMKIPGIENLKIEKPTSKLDIKPTFAYLCNLDEGFSLGTNMFARKDFACLNNEIIITSRYYYNENWYNIKTGELVDIDLLSEDEKELLEDYKRYMRKELDISKSIQIYDFLK